MIGVGQIGRLGLVSGRRAAPSFVGLPLDALSAAAAYSTRRLRTAYTGPLLDVMRSTDSVVQSFGTFAGTGDANGNRWLDLYAVQEFITPGAQLGQTLGQVTNVATGQTFNGLNTFAMVETTAVNNHGSYTPGTTLTPLRASTFVRRGAGSRNLFIGGTNAGQERGIIFDLGTGTMTPLVVGTGGNTTSVTGVMIPVDRVNGWWYCEVVLTTTGGGTAIALSMANGTTLYYPGDGSSSIIHTGPRRASGLGSGFVAAWYDQSGSGRHVTNATPGDQPRIVNAGVYSNEINFNTSTNAGRGRLLFASTLVPAAYPYTTNAVMRQVANNASVILGNLAGAVQFFRIDGQAAARFVPGNPYGTTFDATNHVVVTQTMSSLTNATGWAGGISVGSGTNATAQGLNCSGIGAWSGPVSNFALRELIIMERAISEADRQTLERSQGLAFGIAVA